MITVVPVKLPLFDSGCSDFSQSIYDAPLPFEVKELMENQIFEPTLFFQALPRPHYQAGKVGNCPKTPDPQGNLRGAGSLCVNWFVVKSRDANLFRNVHHKGVISPKIIRAPSWFLHF